MESNLVTLGSNVILNILHEESNPIYDGLFWSEVQQEGKRIYETFDNDVIRGIQSISGWRSVCKVRYKVGAAGDRQFIRRIIKVDCPYCNRGVNICRGETLYTKVLNSMSGHFINPTDKYWVCVGCVAYVKCHDVGNGFLGDEPMGTLANQSLRLLRKQLHDEFDVLWEGGKFGSRRSAYNWLAHRLKIPVHRCHIGMFNEQQCKRALEVVSVFKTKHDL